MGEVVGGILYGIKEVAETAVLVAKGIYDPTLPLKATLTPITSVNIPLAHHTVSIIKGRAYLFGGKTLHENGSAEFAGNEVHIVILPTSGIESADYKKIDATADAPPQRYGHIAAVIDDRIYIFGGFGVDGEPLDENGRVWIFDATSNKWSHIDPPSDGQKPDARGAHASVATEHPKPVTKRPDEGTLPQQPPDPETTMPEIPDPDTYGTVIVQGGQAKSGDRLVDTWTFDISTRTWAELPEVPGPSTPSPSLALVGRRLYSFSEGQTNFLVLDKSSFDDIHGNGELEVAPARPWQSLSSIPSDPEKSHPGHRTASALIPVTTGQGRNYLLLVGGNSQSGEPLEDIWTLQLPPEGMTAASFKDATRQAIKKDTREFEWEEVKYHNSDGVMIQEGQDGRGVGRREFFAAAKAIDVDSSSILVWGGLDANDKPRGDGLLITIEA